MKINRAQRKLLAERITEIGNLAVAALLLGQVIAEKFQLDWTLWGIGILLAMYSVGGILLRGDGQNE